MRVEAVGMEGGWIDFDLAAMAVMKKATEMVLDVLVVGSLPVHVLMMVVLVVNVQLVVDVLDETGVLIHNWVALLVSPI